MVITIAERKYNGKVNRGSIFEKKYEMSLDGETITSAVSLVYCADPSIKGKAHIECSLPMNIVPVQLSELQKLLTEVAQNPEYLHQPGRYNEDRFDPKSLQYVDVTIDAASFEIKKEDPIVAQLLNIINTDNVDALVMETYQKSLKSNKLCCCFQGQPENFLKEKQFEVVKDYGEIDSPSSCNRKLVRCKKCGSLLLHQSLDWNDSLYDDYIQVADMAEADELNAKYGFHNFASAKHPMVRINDKGEVRFALPKNEAKA